MEPPAGGSADRRGGGAGAGPGAPPSGLRRYGLSFSASSLLQAPLAALLEYSGVVPSGPAPPTPQPAVPSSSSSESDGLLSAAAAGDGEVSIRIQGGPGDPDAAGVAAASSPEDSIEATAAPDVDPSSSAGRGGGADADASGGAVGFAEVMDLARPPPLAAADASPEVAACSICLDPVVGLAGERSTARLQCGHEFHLDCIGLAFNAKGAMQCPNCRKIENGRWLYANGHHPSSDFGIGDWVTSEANNLISDHV